ncbi:hypothetical protein HY988_03570 [Candidatus Micrarchaeota archaeon]|nr:hypothetical protein [Candidatus Micrarchaeota archaeon]
MKANYPASVRGGVSGQVYEARTQMQRRGMGALLRAAGVAIERLNRVTDIGCRNGDTTLGLLQALPPSVRVTGVDEFGDAISLAKAKFGLLSAPELAEFAHLISDLPPGWLESFGVDAEPHRSRVSFREVRLTNLNGFNGGTSKPELAIGYQILHWLDCDPSGLPLKSLIASIFASLSSSGVIVAGTSTAFMKMDPAQKVDGMTPNQYSIDEHPFVKMVYEQIAVLVRDRIGSSPTPVLENPPLSKDRLDRQFRKAGASKVEFSEFLVTPGREEVISQVVRIRPAHQGRLNGITDETIRAAIIGTAIDQANADCDETVRKGQADPRLHEGNIWDVVPFIVARK